MRIEELASFLGAVVSLFGAFLTWYIPWHNRSQARMSLVQVHDITQALQAQGVNSVPDKHGWGQPDKLLLLMNIGDGTAYGLRVELNGGKCAILHFDEAPGGIAVSETDGENALPANSQLVLAVWFDQKPEDCYLIVHWVLEPTRLNRQVKQLLAVSSTDTNYPWKPMRENLWKDRFPVLSWRWHQLFARKKNQQG